MTAKRQKAPPNDLTENVNMLKVKEEVQSSHKIGRIAAHVPDIVVYSSLDRETPYAERFNGVLLFADISGFTALTEKFSLSSKKDYGADELTHTLNSYIGDVVSQILADGGDILNYAGDAILALWAVERSQLSEVITLAIRCGLNIQDKCGIRETEVGCQLRVKIGISAGKLSKVIVGDKTSQYYVVIGRAVDEVRLAESLAVAGTVILSPNAWELCNRQNLAIDHIENERPVKVRYIKQVPQFSVENYLQELGKNVEHEILQRSCLRKASTLKPNDERENFMRKYVIKTVLPKIDDNQPLEYLSEMRPATIVFVNLQFEDAICDMELISQCVAIHKAAISIGQQMLLHHGRINKVFMFDKGCTFLCLFGLPGDKRVDECAHALQAAYSIHQACLQEIKSLKTISVGVTTGPVFCGVMGHPLRHEYTVIGRKVNLAARLMMYYPGLVSCDNETCVFSRLPSFYFTELPRKALKGVCRPGPIYQFMGSRHQTLVGKAPMSFQRREGYPLLGRQKELEVYFKGLKDFLEARSSVAKTYNKVIIFEGATGYGKSHLLAEIVHRASKEKVRVMSLELTKPDIKRSNYTLQTVLALLLAIQDCKGYAERERVILSKIHDPELRENVCFLNDILKVKFPLSLSVSLMDSQTKSKEMRRYFLQLCCKLVEKEPCVYVIDQAHFVDQASWSFLLEVCQQASLLMFMALLPQASPNGLFPDMERIICLPHTVYLKLPVLEPPVIAQLACQALSVVHIPNEVKLFLVERSHGVPYYCEELLKSLYLRRMIVIEAIEEEECEDMKILFPQDHSRSSQVWQDKEVQEDDILSGSSQPKCSVVKTRKILALDGSPAEQSFVCLVGKSAKLAEVPIPLTLKGMALAHLDQLQPPEQMLVKCAAIIGHTFTTQMLLDIVPEMTQQKLNLSLVSLFKSGTFECTSRHKNLSLPMSKEAECCSILSCYCAGNEHISSTDVVKPASVAGVWKCQVVCFCTSLVKETAYDLWLKEQKKEIHSKCATYLQQQAYRCHQCARDEFICGHKAAVGGIITDSNDDLTQESYSVPSNQICPMEENGNDEQNFLARMDSMVAERRASIDCTGSCSCAELVECVLIPLVRQWMGVGDVSKAFYCLLESAAACVYLSNYLRALSFLNEAKIILKNLKTGKPAFETADPKVKVKICEFEKACVFRLTGEIQFNTGQILEAEKNFVKALRLLNRRFPRNLVAFSMKYIYEKMKNLHYRHQDLEIPQKREQAFLQEHVCCLSHLWQISCMRRLPKRASLAFTMETNSATCSAEKFKVLFSTVDCFQYSQMVGDEVKCSRYERLLYRRLAQQPYCDKELELIFYFTRSVAIVKLCAGNLEQSVQYTVQAQQVIKVLNRPDLDIYKECVELIQNLERPGTISVAKGWFYAACFDFLLYAGLAVRPFEECLAFVKECESDPTMVADKSLMLNLYSAPALWYARLADWEKVAHFYRKAYGIYVGIPASIHSISGVVKFLECSVLLLKKALSDQNKHTKTIYNKTMKYLSDFSQHYATVCIFLPRVLHLKAFMFLLVGNKMLAENILKQALLLGEKQGNLLDQRWIRQSQDTWSGACTQRPVDWLTATLSMPSWEEAVKLHPKDLLQYCFALTDLSLEVRHDILRTPAASERGHAHPHSPCFNLK
ncbi:adenylate cyclase type 10-like [Colossoma macropomum]|uniref:adenylate cyclase type 10-like n=1 Tax=Colossoma macropomum TaxID=42526 RepID=UPI0018652849|nr:adenylate cyclase type 10-like [Colossoma macropomum]